MGAALLAVLAALAYGIRYTIARRRELAVAARLRIGPDGVIEGAAPIELRGSGRRAVLMLHGFGDTPQTLSYLAQHLHAAGWTVHAPLLPGHGRSVRDFASSRARSWIASARHALEAMQREHGRVSIVGLSMGGAIASIVATEAGDEIPALVLIAPYLSMPTTLRRVAALHWVWGPLVPYVMGRGERSIHDEAERTKSLAYGVSTARLLRELLTVVRLAQRALPQLRMPVRVIQSREDNRIPVDAAERAYAQIASPIRDLNWIDGAGHIITVDFPRAKVFALVEEWLDRHHDGAAVARRVTEA